MTQALKNILNQLDLIENDAVFFRNKEDGEVFDGFSSDINKKLEDIKPDAFYVFNNQPFVLFFDLTSNTDLEKENEIHKKVWSFDNAPIIFVIKDTEVKVYNALSYSKKESSLEKIKLSQNEMIDKFSFWNLQSGNTWKWLQDDYYENNKKKESRKRVNEKLFQNIKEVRETLVDINKSHSLNDNEANSLILRLIFIRYLIDREIKIDTDYISGKSTKDRRISFSSLIKNPEKLNQLFSKLNDNFNGALFKELDIQISKEQSEYLANVFKGEIEEQGSLFEGYYFEIFDFSIIPVEVISGIYESLIDPETRDLDSAVYTPSFLVNYILKDTVDKYLEENNTSECKIFEVAVGSGIFLVQSLRKMIEKEIELNGNSNKKLFSEKIRAIAKDNLFGIDINKEALKVTCFSIYIALLDYQDPKDIEKYPFPNLINENLFEANFFNVNHEFNEIIRGKKTQFILGNPPWKSKKADIFHTNWLKENKKTVGNFEIAQSFLLRSKDFMQSYTKTALIVTSTMFYNVSKTTRAFKNEFLTTFCIDKFFDLSAVKQSLFEQQESPTSIVFYHLSKNNEYLNNLVDHQSLKVNSFLKNFKMLVIEKFDKKEILQKHFIENDWMFKVALYGNTLDFAFITRIKNINSQKLSKFIDNKTLYGTSGILVGNKKNRFDFLEGLPLIENRDVNKYFTKESFNKIEKDDIQIESGRSLYNFDSNKILIKEQAKNWSNLIVSYSENPSVFKKGVFGLSSKNDSLLKRIYSNLISDLYTYYIYSISGGWGVATHPQIKWKEEFLSFPIIETTNSINEELVSLVEKFLNPLKKYYSQDIKSESLPIDRQLLKDINSITNSLYNVKGYEKDLINYVLEVSRYQFQESKQQKFLKKVDNNKEFLEKYIDVYIQEFEKIYDDEFIQVEIYSLDYFIAINFVFLNEKPSKKIVYSDKKEEKQVLKSLANSLSISQITNAKDSEHNLFIQKDIKGFEKNSFYIIKPNEYKCWHRAMAWYDVAEFKEAIQKAELERLNSDFNA
ncbi:Eco57I restriction-modification methylase domain-containing protein [Flavobacterium sp. HNIBRBA15423]|uniref:Eco57I restriction-modification methylase domain-containing protein n=1 Tax=Flavobacterium sp. HNIBRBA15423 TaxID=3458683 RepID=UPI004043FF2A